eukprot:TRINITY_DN1733_c0_g1_i3.p1 TRINITY_DN1733_c0_g1~~TRINITY_DN1733_c0_g1_i3.p1  ORF type:complete len:284 (-),score=60.96 TRINITY_DN1733_c0_g1_i3:1742-2593(-)
MAQVCSSVGGVVQGGRGNPQSLCLQHSSSSHCPKLRRSVRPLHVVAYKHSQNGQNAVEMFVASVDDLEELKERAQNGQQSERRLVPPPRAFKAVELVVKEETTAIDTYALETANLALQTKDKQIEALKRVLLERETQLKYTKSELMEARKELQSKEQLLQDSFNKLSKAAVERQELRDQLILSEKELSNKLEEVMSWSDGLSELNTIMESIDAETNSTIGSNGVSEPPSTLNQHSNGNTILSQENDENSAENILLKILQLSEEMLQVAKEDEQFLLAERKQLQ